MTKFEIKYTEQDVLNSLSIDTIKSTAAVMKKLGCSRNTAKVALDKLEIQGKAKRITIEGNGYGWLKVE